MQSAAVAELLEFDRQAILAGEIWRLWSGHLVHYSVQHALVDYVTALVAAAIVLPALGWRRLLLAPGMAAPLISAGLMLFAPDCLYYRGASGIAVMLVMLAALALWQRAGAGARAALLLLGAGLLLKISMEAAGHVAGWSDLPDGVRVAWQAHLLGAVTGLAIWHCSRHNRCVQRRIQDMHANGFKNRTGCCGSIGDCGGRCGHIGGQAT
ncbi:rhombosortase [Duganella sp. sic0402]|uniref:rhombosortase n=1 Tax=Duganella sp. sic0402 TaxID=2854786 RepID=UPI001C486FC7|nr:rhombosortase [Duganella sp. sic0402]MBV7537645.1 rhombosortase [Duganella sp. sic0402]